MYNMGLFGHMRIHESGIDRSPDTPSMSTTPIMPSPANTPPHSVPTATSSTTTEVDTDTAVISCPHCPRTFTARIGLVSHLRIHRTETGEPVPGAPSYTCRICFHCPNYTRTLIHRMGLLSYIRVHENLR
nr:unnamed protein product [Spirometra erinaceieuropaei]